MDDKDYLYDLLVHDLRGPLSVVATTANSLLSKADRYGALTEAQQVCLQRISRNAKRAQILLNEILDVGRSEAQVFHEEHFYLEGVVRESLINALEVFDEGATERLRKAESGEVLRGVLEQQGISVEITGKYVSAPFFHDRRKIQLIVENLVSNALKYRRKRMNVSISGEGEAVILVSDDGAGIPKKEQELVYGRFMQLGNAGLAEVKGLGLGLFCVKALVKTMGGEILLASQEGCGTSFTVRIPPLKAKR
jgi:signal transduction histidine kinase